MHSDTRRVVDDDGGQDVCSLNNAKRNKAVILAQNGEWMDWLMDGWMDGWVGWLDQDGWMELHSRFQKLLVPRCSFVPPPKGPPQWCWHNIFSRLSSKVAGVSRVSRVSRVSASYATKAGQGRARAERGNHSSSFFFSLTTGVCSIAAAAICNDGLFLSLHTHQTTPTRRTRILRIPFSFTTTTSQICLPSTSGSLRSHSSLALSVSSPDLVLSLITEERKRIVVDALSSLPIILYPTNPTNRQNECCR